MHRFPHSCVFFLQISIIRSTMISLQGHMSRLGLYFMSTSFYSKHQFVCEGKRHQCVFLCTHPLNIRPLVCLVVTFKPLRRFSLSVTLRNTLQMLQLHAKQLHKPQQLSACSFISLFTACYCIALRRCSRLGSCYKCSNQGFTNVCFFRQNYVFAGEIIFI